MVFPWVYYAHLSSCQSIGFFAVPGIRTLTTERSADRIRRTVRGSSARTRPRAASVPRKPAGRPAVDAKRNRQPTEREDSYMTNNIFRMIDGKMFHSVSLAFREYDSYIERDSYASGACWRFLQAASLLSDGECLGLQIAARHRDDRRVLAYSSSGVAVTQDDFRWIFHHCSAGANLHICGSKDCEYCGCLSYCPDFCSFAVLIL